MRQPLCTHPRVITATQRHMIGPHPASYAVTAGLQAAHRPDRQIFTSSALVFSSSRGRRRPGRRRRPPRERPAAAGSEPTPWPAPRRSPQPSPGGPSRPRCPVGAKGRVYSFRQDRRPRGDTWAQTTRAERLSWMELEDCVSEQMR